MEGREKWKMTKRPGHPPTSKTEETLENTSEIVWKDRRLSIRMIAEMADMDKETVRQILHDRLIIRKICLKMVPKNLTQKQKDNRKHIYSDIMERITELDVFQNVITYDEPWIFQYDLETKRQLTHWKTSTSPRMKKARMKSRM
jgi:hypothetical protein